MFGGTITVKAAPLLAILLTVTTTFPDVAPVGTGTTMLVALQLVGVAAVPLNVTVLVPWDAPKLVPVTATEVPTGPDAGLRLAIAGVTVKVAEPFALEMPPTVTSTLARPASTLFGTEATILVGFQLMGVATRPPMVTVLVPCGPPNALPVMVTEVPAGPDVGFMLVISGVTVKFTLLLAWLPTVTTTAVALAVVKLGTTTVRAVAVQFTCVTAVPPKLTVLEPCALPKPVPNIVILVPTGPEVWLRKLMLGTTVKSTPLLATPPTVTTTLPVAAPEGTGTTMLVALQLLGVAVVPLKVTVLVPCEAPKLAPAMVTDVPAGPEVGLRLVMLGPGFVTVKATPLLATPLTLTTTLPDVAPVGTGTTMLV